MDEYLNALTDPGATMLYPPDSGTWRPARPNQQQKCMIHDSVAFDQQQQMRMIQEAKHELETHGQSHADVADGIGADPGSAARPTVLPTSIANLQLWLKADTGIATVVPQYISEIVLTDAGSTFANGTYTRASGGHTSFYNEDNGSSIEWSEYDIWNVVGLSNDEEETLTLYTLIILEINGVETIDDTDYGDGIAPLPSHYVTTVTTGITGVQSWADQSGHGRNFEKNITNTGFATLCSGAVLFTASEPYGDINASVLATESNNLNFTTPYTLIAAVRAGASNSCVFSKSTGDDKRRKYQMSMNSGIFSSLESQDGDDTNISYDTGTGDNVLIKRLLVTQYASNTSGLIRYNGAQVATGSMDVGIDQTNGASVCIGCSPFEEGSGYNAEASTQMHVYEIIFYNRAITTAECQQVEAYLNAKYTIY